MVPHVSVVTQHLLMWSHYTNWCGRTHASTHQLKLSTATGDSEHARARGGRHTSSGTMRALAPARDAEAAHQRVEKRGDLLLAPNELALDRGQHELLARDLLEHAGDRSWWLEALRHTGKPAPPTWCRSEASAFAAHQRSNSPGEHSEPVEPPGWGQTWGAFEQADDGVWVQDMCLRW